VCEEVAVVDQPASLQILKRDERRDDVAAAGTRRELVLETPVRRRQRRPLHARSELRGGSTFVRRLPPRVSDNRDDDERRGGDA